MDRALRQMLGQMLMFGFHGLRLPEDFVRLVQEYQVGGVILFRRNVRDAAQLRQLCADIQTLVRRETGQPAFIAMDQEGGMVSRLPPDAVNVPGAMALAATGREENVRAAAAITARQFRGLGVNFNLAPVLDVNSNPRNPVIGVRSFGDEPEAVARLGVAAIGAYAGSGVLCCGKHFPGHGDTAVDSHLGLPTVEKTWEELGAVELVPFRRAVEAGVDAIMVGHMRFPKIDGGQVPSTMSRRFITDLLRRELGFSGLIITDCMEMGAIRDHYGTDRGVVEAIRAGADIAEISASLPLMEAAAQRLHRAAEAGALDLDRLRRSAERIARVKQKLLAEPEPELLNSPRDRQAAWDMARQAVTCWAGSPFPVDGNTFFCGCADYRVSGAGNESSDAGSFPEHMAAAFGARGLVTGKDPGPREIAAAVRQARECGGIVLGTCNAHLFPGQLALARALAETGRPMAVAALRDPYDLPLLPGCRWALAAYDYTPASLAAVEAVLRGGPALGKCPVRL